MGKKTKTCLIETTVNYRFYKNIISVNMNDKNMKNPIQNDYELK